MKQLIFLLTALALLASCKTESYGQGIKFEAFTTTTTVANADNVILNRPLGGSLYGNRKIRLDLFGPLIPGLNASNLASGTIPAARLNGVTPALGATTVPADPYNATTWNGNLQVPTKDDVRDALVAFTVDWSAARVIACPPMSPAHQINVTKMDQKEALTADVTLTLSATPAANTWFGWTLTGDAASWRTVTLPVGTTWISENAKGVITSFIVSKGVNVTATILASYDGTNYHIYGDPVIGTGVGVKKTGVNYTIGTDDPRELYGGIIYVTAACTVSAPAIQPDMNFTVISEGAFVVSVDVNAADKIVRDGVVQADGEKITSPGAVNDMAVFTYHDVDGFYAVTNAWTNGG